MAALVTPERLKSVLRVDHVDDDATLTFLAEAASTMVQQYLKADILILAPDEVVQLAVIALVGVLYREPDGNENGEWSHGNLPVQVTSILYPYRDPALR